MGQPQATDLFKLVAGATQGVPNSGTHYSVSWAEMIAAAAASLLITDVELADSLSIYGTAAVQDVGYFATAAQGGLADTALQDASAFATAAQGAKADTAVQPAALTPYALSANVYDQATIDAALGAKADQATTYTITQVDSALALKADASAVYTQSQVDTALAGKANAADVYTKAETDNAIATLINGAPGLLDTLDEIAASLGDDPDFATTMTNALAGKADIATTLAGYGITNAYTQTETNTQINSAISALNLGTASQSDTGDFAAASHTHVLSELLGFGAAGGYIRSNGTSWVRTSGVAWGDLTSVPATIQNIDTELANKANWDTAFGWGDHASGGYLAASSYTAADVLAKLLTVDGAGTGLEADLLDGYEGSYYLDYNNLINTPSGAGTGDAVLADNETVTGQWTFDNHIRVIGSIYGGPNSPVLGSRALHVRDDSDTVGDFVFQSTDQKLRFQTYWESGVGQWSSIQSTNDAENSPQTLYLNPDGGTVRWGNQNNAYLDASGDLVAKDIRVTRGDDTGAIYFGDGGDHYLYYAGDNFYLNSANLQVDGNMGIGVAPAVPLHIQVADTNTEAFRVSNSTDSARTHIFPGEIQTQNSSLNLWDYDTLGVIFYQGAGATEIARFNTSGYLTLGTANSQGARLTSNAAAVNPPTLGTEIGHLWLSNDGGAYGLNAGVAGTGNAWLQVHRGDGTGTAYDLLLQPSGGNVAIGHDSPAAMLSIGENTFQRFNFDPTVASSSYQTTITMTNAGIEHSTNSFARDWIWQSNGAEYVRFDNGTQRVGIGSPVPGTKLHVQDSPQTPALATTVGHITLQESTGGNGLMMGMFYDGSNPTYAWLQAQFTGGVSQAYPIALNPLGGNVGIGISSPDRLFHVSTSSSTPFRITRTESNFGTGIEFENDLGILPLFVTPTGAASGRITPDSGDTFDLGSSSFPFADLYLSGDIYSTGAVITPSAGYSLNMSPTESGDGLLYTSPASTATNFLVWNQGGNAMFNHYSDSAGGFSALYYMNGTAIGEFSATDTTWFRINQSVAKNIYTPRYIRADNGFFVDGAVMGITGTGYFRPTGGSSSAPGVASVNDTNTGIFWSAADHVQISTGGTQRAYFNSTSLYANNFTIISDRRTKKNVRPLQYGLKDILKLRAVLYDRKDLTRSNEMGFISQEVEEVMPELILEDTTGQVKDGPALKHLDYARITAPLVNAIAELQEQINELKAQLKAA